MHGSAAASGVHERFTALGAYDYARCISKHRLLCIALGTLNGQELAHVIGVVPRCSECKLLLETNLAGDFCLLLHSPANGLLVFLLAHCALEHDLVSNALLADFRFSLDFTMVPAESSLVSSRAPRHGAASLDLRGAYLHLMLGVGAALGTIRSLCLGNNHGLLIHLMHYVSHKCVLLR